MNLTKLLCALVMFVLPVVAAAADISSEQIAGGPVVIRLKGEIQKGDDEQFRRMSLRHPAAVVHLDSAGGALIPALEIGRIVRIAGYSTLVLPNTSCTSACALIWLAGKKRILDGRVGFHAAYRDNEGRLQESGAANALIGNYMTQLGLPAKAILFATAAPPDKILWLTAETRGNAGIDFEVPPPPIQIITRADRGVCAQLKGLHQRLGCLRSPLARAAARLGPSWGSLWKRTYQDRFAFAARQLGASATWDWSGTIEFSGPSSAGRSWKSSKTPLSALAFVMMGSRARVT